MNSLLDILSTFGQILQNQLFPVLEEELGPLGEHHQDFVRALALLQMDGFVAVRHGRGRPANDRACLARAFLAKAVFNLPHTRALLDRLAHDITLRRLCGWERASQIPHESAFSRAFAEFAESELAQRVHAALIQRTQSQRTTYIGCFPYLVQCPRNSWTGPAHGFWWRRRSFCVVCVGRVEKPRPLTPTARTSSGHWGASPLMPRHPLEGVHLQPDSRAF